MRKTDCDSGRPTDAEVEVDAAEVDEVLGVYEDQPLTRADVGG